MKLGRSVLRRRSMVKGLACGQAGFTLIEVVIVTVIIGILTAIALPSYTAYIMRSNRSDARAQLLMASQWMERVRNESGRYDLNGGVPVALPATLQAVAGDRDAKVQHHAWQSCSGHLYAHGDGGRDDGRGRLRDNDCHSDRSA